MQALLSALLRCRITQCNLRVTGEHFFFCFQTFIPHQRQKRIKRALLQACVLHRCSLLYRIPIWSAGQQDLLSNTGTREGASSCSCGFWTPPPPPPLSVYPFSTHLFAHTALQGHDAVLPLVECARQHHPGKPQ